MGSGSEDEDEDGSSVGHQVHDQVGSRIVQHGLTSSGSSAQSVGHAGDLPLGSDPCKQEDSEDQGSFFHLNICKQLSNISS